LTRSGDSRESSRVIRDSAGAWVIGSEPRVRAISASTGDSGCDSAPLYSRAAGPSGRTDLSTSEIPWKSSALGATTRPTRPTRVPEGSHDSISTATLSQPHPRAHPRAHPLLRIADLPFAVMAPG
jgi:hypothetical protein